MENSVMNQFNPAMLEKINGETTLFISLEDQCKIKVIGLSEHGAPKEYFLKVTERKGLVLV